MIVGWAILSPISKFNGWAPGPVGDMTSGARGWILWTALAIMISDSMISLGPVFREFVSRASKPFRKQGSPVSLPQTPLTPVPGTIISAEDDFEDDKDSEPPERLVPNNWIWSGLGASLVVGTLLVWTVFGAEGIKPWATIIGFLMGGILSLLGYVLHVPLDIIIDNRW